MPYMRKYIAFSHRVELFIEIAKKVRCLQFKGTIIFCGAEGLKWTMD